MDNTPVIENVLMEDKFYIRKGNLQISYYMIYSYLENLRKSNAKEGDKPWENTDENGNKIIFKLTIISYEEKTKTFIFKIDDNTEEFAINKKNKIYYYKDEDENKSEEYEFYNIEQIEKFLEDKNENNNLIYQYYDKNNKDLSFKHSNDFFFALSKIKALSIGDDSSNKKNEFDYNNYFNEYMKNNNDKEKFQIYSKIGDNEYIKSEQRDELINRLNKFVYSYSEKKNYMAFTGISGIGKTTTFLYFLKKLYLRTRSCYFNMKYLLLNSNAESLSKEFINLFTNGKEKKKYLELVNKIKNEDDKYSCIWTKIKVILDYIQENFSFTQKVIIIDQYKNSFDQNYMLYDFIKSKKYKSFNFIICSSANEKDIKSDITFNIIENNDINSKALNYEYLDELCSVKNIIKNKKIKEMMELFNYIPLYYTKFTSDYLKDEENLDEKIVNEKIKKFLLFEFKYITTKMKVFFEINNINIIENYNIITQILQGKELSRFSFVQYINIIPLKYCTYKKQNNEVFVFSAAFNFLYFCLREIYKNQSFNCLAMINNISKNRSELGNIFDSLVNWHFDINKEIFGFKINHVLILNEIVNFSYIIKIINNSKDYFTEYNNELNINSLFDEKIIYLEQNNTNGSYVDGGFLFPIKGKPKHYNILLYQSSIKKREKFTKYFLYNIIFKAVKNNLEQICGIHIEQTYFMYITNEEDKSLTEYCRKNDIYLIYFSIDNENHFRHTNYKSVGNLLKYLDKLEIFEQDKEKIKLFEEIKETNDISSLENFCLNKKRKMNKNEDKKNEEITKDNIIFKKNKKGQYENSEARLIKVKNKKINKEDDDDEEIKDNNSVLINLDENNDNIKLDKNIISTKNEKNKEEKTNIKFLNNNIKKIFPEYSRYEVIKEKMNIGTAIIEFPIFYIFKQSKILFFIKKVEETKKKLFIFNIENGNEIKDENEIVHFFNLNNLCNGESTVEVSGLLD